MGDFSKNKKTMFSAEKKDPSFLEIKDFVSYQESEKRCLDLCYEDDDKEFNIDLALTSIVFSITATTDGFCNRIKTISEIDDPNEMRKKLEDLLQNRQDFLRYVNYLNLDSNIRPENYEAYKKQNKYI